MPLRVLVPAFMLSGLRVAFVAGFISFLPFLLIDLVVAAILMALGMMMVPPVSISLPLKVLLIVLIDGCPQSSRRPLHGPAHWHQQGSRTGSAMRSRPTQRRSGNGMRLPGSSVVKFLSLTKPCAH